MVDIQSAAAESRRGKKDEKKKKETTWQKYNGLPNSAITKPSTYGSHRLSLTL